MRPIQCTLSVFSNPSVSLSVSIPLIENQALSLKLFFSQVHPTHSPQASKCDQKHSFSLQRYGPLAEAKAPTLAQAPMPQDTGRWGKNRGREITGCRLWLTIQIEFRGTLPLLRTLKQSTSPLSQRDKETPLM